VARHLFVVLSEPVEGLEDEYNDWYTNKHLSDVLKLDDFVSAQRFRHTPKHPEDVPLRRYLALYDAETDDLNSTYRRLNEVADTDAMPFSPAFDKSKSIAMYFEAITDKRSS
jgi:hypothetical protein